MNARPYTMARRSLTANAALFFIAAFACHLAYRDFQCFRETPTVSAFRISPVPATNRVSSRVPLPLKPVSRRATGGSATDPAVWPASESRRMGELSESEQIVYNIFQDIHNSKYAFRVIVIGSESRAILESTTVLGPVRKVTQSPSTGKNLLTLANEDQSFEYHIQLSSISKIELVTKNLPVPSAQSVSGDAKSSPNQRRLVRLLGADGKGVSTLILADSSGEAKAFFEGLVSKYGEAILLHS
jgi:hypothetical protein